jgi:hypothetical protein
VTRLVDWLRARPRAWAPLALAWALLLGLPTLPVGYVLDDHVHRYGFTGFPSPAQGLDLFSFTPKAAGGLAPFIRSGPFPWWTHPELRVRFFRPLSSALLHVDHALFPDRPLPAHAHSLLWNLAFVAVGLLLLRRLVPAGPVQALAMLLFAAAAPRWMAATWLANRNALVAGTFALLGFWAHLRWRQDGWRAGAVLSALCFAAGLTGAEVAVAFLAYPVAHELTARGASWRRRLVGLVPVLLSLAAYGVAYRLTLSGARHSGTYLDPLGAPLAYLAAAPARVLALLGSLAAQLPVDLWLTAPGLRPVIVGVALVVVGAVARAVRPLDREDPGRLRFLVLAAALSLLPAAAVFPMARQVLPASLAGAALFAWLAQHAWRHRRVALLGLVLGVHLALPSATWLVMPTLAKAIGERTDAAVAAMELEADWSKLRVLALTTPDPSMFLYAPLQRAVELGSVPRAWWILTHGLVTLDLHRVDDATLEVAVVGGRLLDGEFEQVVRSPNEPFAAGDRVVLEGAAVEVLALDGGFPTRLRVTVEGGFDAPDLRVLAYRDGTFRRVALPAVGGTLRLETSPGPMTP